MGKESDAAKSKLVLDICALSTLSISCSHRNTSYSSVNPHFIDWYRLLGVEEDAGVDFIRKRYRKLALQLHPDKNKHPQAEIAFKLALEAYSNLSDTEKRRSFNSERRKNFCIKCNRIPYRNHHPESNKRSSSSRILKERFREEAKVMENCLKANAALRNNNNNDNQSPLFNPIQSSNVGYGLRRESPIFNPSDYVLEGYPHIRNRIYMKPEEVWYSRRQSSSSFPQRKTKYDSPIFENRSVTRICKSEPACVSS
ncbi:pre-mRNA-splicing factor cwf23 [Euphorbia lathyris]|uniref:pre-mRNA-splicing factor cwf23 n=1 Tax=Euphorbia lathyris TaxID=212925 RepID=UPI0033142854